MIDLVKEVVAPWKVRWNVVDASGRIAEECVTIRFLRLGAREYNELFLEQPAGTLAEVYAQSERIFLRVARGWEGVMADGEPVKFSPENARLLLDYPGFAGACGEAYTRFFFAQAEEREKNSVSSPASGPESPSRATTTGK